MKFSYILVVATIAKEVIGQFMTFKELNDIIKFGYDEGPNILNLLNFRFDTSVLIDIKCYNPTTKTTSSMEYLNVGNISSKIDINKPIAFIIHGWRSSVNVKWMRDMTLNWQRARDENICRIDWSVYAGFDYITAATRYVRTVGEIIGRFINELAAMWDVQFKNIILVGHSLGAHIAGYVGSECQGNVGKIIGLDPAGPLFTFPFLIPTLYRLDKSDANLVQVIHTSDRILGIGIQSGHQDFYINYGTFPQKGCFFPFLVESYYKDPIGCAHLRSVQFFIDSLQNNMKCVAVKCDKIFEYFFRRCTNVYDVMGLDTFGNEGKFYFETEDKPVCTGKVYNNQNEKNVISISAEVRDGKYERFVKKHVNFEYDSVSVEAKYHDELCVSTKGDAGRPLDENIRTAMDNVVHYIENNEDCQFTLAELKDVMTDYVPGDKTISRNLIARNESNTVTTTKSKYLTIICSQDTAANILTQSWYEEKKQNQCGERLRIVESAGSIIIEDIRSITFSHDFYPPPS